MRWPESDPAGSSWIGCVGARTLAVGASAVIVGVVVWAVVGVVRSGGAAEPVAVAALSVEPLVAPVPEAAPPMGPLPRRVPAEGVLVTDGPAVERVALTFDDGYCERCVRGVLELLAETGIPATMFPLGIHAEAWEASAALILSLVASGQIDFGNHTFTHEDATGLSRRDLRRQLRSSERWIWETFGSNPRPLFRPPFGAYDDRVLDVAGNQGYATVVTWSVSGLDWQERTREEIAATVRELLKPGAIILLHPNRMATVEALPMILSDIERRGFEVVLLRDLLAQG